MRGFPRPGNVLAALLIVAPAAAPVAAAQTTLSPAAMARAGIALATLHTVRMTPSIAAIGTVLDPAPLIELSGQMATLDAQIEGAKAKVILQQQQMAQASALYKRGQIISLADYQKAAQDLAASRSALGVALAKRKSLDQQTQATWGPIVAGIVRSDGDPLPQVAAGKAMLVGLSLPPGASLAMPPREIEVEAQGIRFAVRLIAGVPRMLGGFPGQAILCQAAAEPGIPIGATVAASLPTGAERAGVVVPWSAVLWKGDKALVFRAAADGHFEPVPIATDAPTADGYFVAASLAQGNQIVVRGAALLLGGPKPASGGDEDDEGD
jgi:hypothetical protein